MMVVAMVTLFPCPQKSTLYYNKYLEIWKNKMERFENFLWKDENKWSL